MDSGGNSGSLLSSSEADEEYDSRAAVDSVSPFISDRQIPPPPLSFFDPIPSYLHRSPAINWAGSSQPGPVPDEVLVKHHQPAPPPPRPPAARNPRKRSRASRRAPTTVLTTDTTNFRAMVQEFTGIPSPPFGGGSRFDILGRFNSTQQPPYLRRPFAQKVQSTLPFLTAAPSSLFTSAAAVPISSPDSIQIPQINDYQLQQTSKTGNQFAINPNQIFTSILRSNPKFPSSSDPPLIPSRSQASNSFNLIDDQFVSLGHDGNPDSLTLPRLPRWGNNPETPNAGGFSFMIRPSEMNFDGDKVPENDVAAVASREGVVGSSSPPWICSSE